VGVDGFQFMLDMHGFPANHTFELQGGCHTTLELTKKILHDSPRIGCREFQGKPPISVVFLPAFFFKQNESATWPQEESDQDAKITITAGYVDISVCRIQINADTHKMIQTDDLIIRPYMNDGLKQGNSPRKCQF
jgi:hypothetical protein